MEKITFVNNEAPYLSAENLNQMQDNIETEITETANKIIDVDVSTSGEAVKTGRKFDGKDEYVKRIDIGDCPNTTYKMVATGLEFSEINLIEIRGSITDDSTYNLTLPYVQIGGTGSVNVYMENNDLTISSDGDMSSKHGYANIYFTYKN